MARLQLDHPHTARRAEWELPMQVFGVSPDIDAHCRRRRVSGPAAMASRAEVGRRAAKFGDIVDVLGRRHFAPVADNVQFGEPSPGPLAGPPSEGADAAAASGRPACGVLPFDSETYDFPERADAGAAAPRSRRYFDGSFKAQRYAELIGRPDVLPHALTAPTVPEGWIPELPVEERLPLAIRRVLSAAMPRKHDPDFPAEVAHRLRAEVEAEALRRLRSRRARILAEARAPRGRSAGALGGAALAAAQSEKPLELEAGAAGESASPSAPAAALLPEVTPEDTPASPLPTLLTSRPHREPLDDKLLGKQHGL